MLSTHIPQHPADNFVELMQHSLHHLIGLSRQDFERMEPDVARRLAAIETLLTNDTVPINPEEWLYLANVWQHRPKNVGELLSTCREMLKALQQDKSVRLEAFDEIEYLQEFCRLLQGFTSLSSAGQRDALGETLEREHSLFLRAQQRLQQSEIDPIPSDQRSAQRLRVEVDAHQYFVAMLQIALSA